MKNYFLVAVHIFESGNFDLTPLFQSSIYHIDLDHNNLYFNNTNKTFAWKSVREGDGLLLLDCDNYQMSSVYGCYKGCLCSNEHIESWPFTNETSITVGEDDLFDDQGQLVVFDIDAYDSNQTACTNNALIAKFLVDETG